MIETMTFNILYEDDDLIAIEKPSGILVHRTPMSEDTVFVLQLLRDQLGQKVYAAHRLDRATSGVLVFGKNERMATLMGQLFMRHGVHKQYHALVRGWVEDHGIIDYALKDEETGVRVPQEAISQYTCLEKSEIKEAIGNKYPTARFSLVAIQPKTGRRHQIRKHFAHIFHPIIGDRRHGDVKQNNFFRDNWGFSRMMLHASSLQFIHPVSNQSISITCPMDSSFQEVLRHLGFVLSDKTLII
jgi:tRNA pseudouridine65 synthase